MARYAILRSWETKAQKLRRTSCNVNRLFVTGEESSHYLEPTTNHQKTMVPLHYCHLYRKKLKGWSNHIRQFPSLNKRAEAANMEYDFWYVI